MKLSIKGNCAVEMMLDILDYGQKSPVAIKDVAARLDISNKYAEQVVSTLSVAGLVKSVRGQKGGYQATDKAKTATVGTILRLTESFLKEQNAVTELSSISVVVEDLNKAVDRVLDHYTLMMLLDMKHDIGNDYII
jgi:Rrf2 family protein